MRAISVIVTRPLQQASIPTTPYFDAAMIAEMRLTRDVA
jgi:hypothetical protein